ncbi:uncharacterized protein [Typha angustifolia]|uniref:uncharacterized protein isoform X2 n=1 Tax=Typha angustifolia TaxID=59011 RepID=UPI003C2ACC45
MVYILEKLFMSPKYNECSGNCCPKPLLSENVDCELSSINVPVSSTSSSDLSIINNLCPNSAPKWDGNVYKRRKTDRNFAALLSEENITENINCNVFCHSCISSKDHSSALQSNTGEVPLISLGSCAKDLQNTQNLLKCEKCHQKKPITTLSSQTESIPDSMVNRVTSTLECEKMATVSNAEKHGPALDLYSGANDRWSSSISNISSFPKTEAEDAGECSSSDIYIVKQFRESMSPRELCIILLKIHGLLGGRTGKKTDSKEALCDNDPNYSLSLRCKICGFPEHPSKMLICDQCEEAFHLSCCNARLKEMPVDDEWYCQPCFRKKPKISSRKLLNSRCERSEHRNRTRGDLVTPITSMLKDIQPYTSGVRIGKNFQAEVPNWSGSISNSPDYFNEPSQVDPTEFSKGWNAKIQGSRPSSIGNWIQCRALLAASGNNKRTICGKWRRAPLFILQTDDWDCSCSVLWDPAHADCAVPQELVTDEVLKHLKYINMLRSRLVDRERKLG